MNARPRGTVFWDFDGTLASRPNMWSGGCLESLDELVPDHRVRPEDVRGRMSRGFPWHAPEQSYAHLTEPAAWWRHVASHLTGVLRELGIQHDLERLVDRIREHILDGSRYKVYEDVIPALEGLSHDGWRQIILSNHVPELETIIDQIGLRSYFTHVLSSARVGFEKPNPLIFRHALGLVESQGPTWMIGDSERADCVPARALGIHTILVRDTSSNYEPRAADAMKAADIVRSSLALRYPERHM